MRLQDFLPYRLAILAEDVSQCMAQVYRERFGLTRDEWRVLSALGDGARARTAQVIALCALDKMPVSRAVTRLERDGLLRRTVDPQDARGFLLQLSPAGRALYQKIVPMVQAREAFLLEALTPEERQGLDGALSRLHAQARQLKDQG